MVCLCILGIGCISGGAADIKAPDADLPQPYDPGSAGRNLLTSSPFTRPLNLSDSLLLTGIAYVKGKPVATIKDRSTNKNHIVSDEPNELGWKLESATPSTELRRSEVKISVGGEVIVVRYSDAQVALKGKPGPSKYPTDAEAIRTDENGKPYVRASAYLSDTDRDRYYKGWSREAHDKFREVVRDSRDKMFAASPEERAALSKKMFDAIDAEEKARAAK
jgi:hypothetical protein